LPVEATALEEWVTRKSLKSHWSKDWTDANANTTESLFDELLFCFDS